MRHQKLFYGSSYDRGLEHLLKMWPQIKDQFPDATLDVAYGWDLFVKTQGNNPNSMEWKKKMDDLMSSPGITHHGRISKEKLSEIRKSCGIWAYPTHFTEINCITALESQADGLVPVVINYAALKETVGSGVRVEGDIYDQETKDEYLKQLLLLMGDEKRWQVENEQARQFAQKFSWDLIAAEWSSHFKIEDLTYSTVTKNIPDNEVGSLYKRVMVHFPTYEPKKEFISHLQQGDLDSITDKENCGYYQFLACLVKELNPKQIVELGGSWGASALMMASELKQGKIWTITKDEGGIEFGYLKEGFPMINRIVGDDLKLESWPKKLKWEKKQIIFIDTDHTYDQVKAELELYLPLIPEGCVILFDDIHLSPDMERIWDEVDKVYKLKKLDISNPCHYSGFGMAIK